MGTGKMKKMSRQQQKAVGASMNEAAGKMLTPLEFGASGASLAGIPTSLFGTLGGNPNINSLTNANAIAAQQAATNVGAIGAQQAIQPMGSGVSNDMLDPSGLMATGRFNPAARNIGMGMFGDMGARNRSVLGGIGSALMMHDEEKIKRLEAEIADISENGEDSKFVNEGEDPQDAAFRRKSDIMDEKKKHKSALLHKKDQQHTHEKPKWRKEQEAKFQAEKDSIAAEKARLLKITQARRKEIYGK